MTCGREVKMERGGGEKLKLKIVREGEIEQ